MLVSAKEMLQKAKAGKYAVGQFNIQVQRHEIACPFFQNRMCDF